MNCDQDRDQDHGLALWSRERDQGPPRRPRTKDQKDHAQGPGARTRDQDSGQRTRDQGSGTSVVPETLMGVDMARFIIRMIEERMVHQ